MTDHRPSMAPLKSRHRDILYMKDTAVTVFKHHGAQVCTDVDRQPSRDYNTKNILRELCGEKFHLRNGIVYIWVSSLPRNPFRLGRGNSEVGLCRLKFIEIKKFQNV